MALTLPVLVASVAIVAHIMQCICSEVSIVAHIMQLYMVEMAPKLPMLVVSVASVQWSP